MTTIADLAQTLQEVLTTTADALARKTGFVQRASKLTGAAFAQALVFGWLATPHATVAALAPAAAAVGVPISPQGLDQRMGASAAVFMEELLGAAGRAVVAAEPVAVPVLERFTAVALCDSAPVALPAALARRRGRGRDRDQGRRGAQAARPRRSARRDASRAALDRRAHHRRRRAGARRPAAGRRAARRRRGRLRPGRRPGQGRARRLLARAPAVHHRSLRRGRPAPGGARPARAPTPSGTGGQADEADRAVTLGVEHRLPARLLAVRVPPEVANARRRRTRADAKRHGRAGG